MPSTATITTTTTISTKGQFILPAVLRQRDGIEAGQRFEVRRLGPGRYLVVRVAGARQAGLVDRLRACPHKGWFSPLPRTETTDDIAPRRSRR